MAYTTINKSTDYFRTKLYTGNASNDTAITFDESTNMQPDLIWIKNRSASQSHALFDAIRGATKRLSSNSSSAESTENTNLDSFDTNGFTVDNEAIVNGSGNSMVAWNWKAGTTSGIATNADSDITPTAYSFNATSGFSIVKYTGNGSGSTGVPHGLGKKPEFFIIKKTSGTDSWICYHQGISNNGTTYIVLNSSAASGSSNNPFNGWQSDTVNFYLGSAGDTNGSGATFIAYCFASVDGFSKVGSYVGNGNANGTFIYTGFKPAFIIFKRRDNTGEWYIKDNRRSGTAALQNIGQMNPNQTQYVAASSNQVENKTSGYAMDILSNGFKARGTDSGINANGGEYIYYAVAEAPLVGSNNIPCTAR